MCFLVLVPRSSKPSLVFAVFSDSRAPASICQLLKWKKLIFFFHCFEFFRFCECLGVFSRLSVSVIVFMLDLQLQTQTNINTLKHSQYIYIYITVVLIILFYILSQWFFLFFFPFFNFVFPQALYLYLSYPLLALN